MTKNTRLKIIDIFLLTISVITYFFLLSNYAYSFISNPYFRIDHCIISFVFVIILILQLLFSSYRKKIFCFTQIHFTIVILACLICFKVSSLPLLTIIFSWLAPCTQIILLLKKVNIDIDIFIFIIISNLMIVFCMLMSHLYRKRRNK